MYDKYLVSDILEEMIDASRTISSRCAKMSCMDDFVANDKGQMVLDSICMLLIAIGEAVKQIDRITDKTLLVTHPDIPWGKVAAMRDILSHHYFDLNAEIVYNLCQDHIGDLHHTLVTIHSDLQ